MKKYLITSALPYANGPLHFGHLAGAYLPADVYARHRRNQGGDVIYISGSDEHGVAIMLNAKKAGIDYKEYVDRWHKEHKELFADYGVEFDFFDEEGWPHYKVKEEIPFLKAGEQSVLMKEAVIEYFLEKKLID